MKIWVVTAISCRECNSVHVASFDHDPTESEISNVSDECGGMNCIETVVTETELDER